jgi:FtsH-binding integral membrane protein
MDVFRSFQSGNAVNLNTLTNFSNLSAKAQRHLLDVYKTLCGMLVLATLGVVVQIQLQINITLCAIATFGFMMWLLFTAFDPYDAEQQKKRLLLLGTVAFLKGTVVGPLIELAAQVDPILIATALCGTGLIFACFSAAAMCARRRSYLYLIGMLSSATTLLALLSFVNIFARSSSIDWIQLYGGLMVFSGYVVYDTQLIIEKAELSHPDYIRAALELFIDFVAIFIRILIILLRNSQSKKEKSRSNRRD